MTTRYFISWLYAKGATLGILVITFSAPDKNMLLENLQIFIILLLTVLGYALKSQWKTKELK